MVSRIFLSIVIDNCLLVNVVWGLCVEVRHVDYDTVWGGFLCWGRHSWTFLGTLCGCFNATRNLSSWLRKRFRWFQPIRSQSGGNVWKICSLWFTCPYLFMNNVLCVIFYFRLSALRGFKSLALTEKFID